jgi:hypothetical protein
MNHYMVGREFFSEWLSLELSNADVCTVIGSFPARFPAGASGARKVIIF